VTRALAVLCLLAAASSQARAAISVAVDPALDRRDCQPLDLRRQLRLHRRVHRIALSLAALGWELDDALLVDAGRAQLGQRLVLHLDRVQIADPAQLPNGSEPTSS
jgi:hypothetical protein